MRVCVGGSGKAAAEAAREAVRGGAEVDLVDASDRPVPDWQYWPDLIGGAGRGPPPTARPVPAEVGRISGSRVLSIAGGSASLERGGGIAADSFVLALPPGFETLSFGGRNKAGVTVMDSPRGYERFGGSLASAGRVAVAGEASRGLQIAQKAATGGRQVVVFASSWQHGPPGPAVVEVLADAAMARGIRVVRGRVDRALGRQRLEAVLSAGDVFPSDALAAVPRRVPRRTPPPAPLGRRGGVCVGLDMRAGCAGLFAAGGSAEVGEGNPPWVTLEDEEGPSGRVAGAGAAGSAVRLSRFRRWSCSVFGLAWSHVGLGVAPAWAPSLGLRAVSERLDERSACAVVYDRRSGAVMGLELVSDPAQGEALLPRLDRPVTLRDLAYGGLGSSDITAVSDTARLALEAWSKS